MITSRLRITVMMVMMDSRLVKNMERTRMLLLQELLSSGKQSSTSSIIIVIVRAETVDSCLLIDDSFLVKSSLSHSRFIPNLPLFLTLHLSPTRSLPFFFLSSPSLAPPPCLCPPLPSLSNINVFIANHLNIFVFSISTIMNSRQLKC